MTQTIPLGSDARERFVLEIAKVLPAERIVEAHFFAPLRQGQIETGVCVLGALPEGADPLPYAGLDNRGPLDTSALEANSDLGSSEPAVSAGAAEEGNREHLLSKRAEHSEDLVEGAIAAADDPSNPFPAGARISSRHVVYSARYRWTRKGPERGKWECEVVAEADAPLLTVEAVVQGVRQRASEPLEVAKLDGDTVRGMIAQALKLWQKTA